MRGIRDKTGEFEYIYTTDKNGHISSFHADELNLKTHEGRLPYNPNTPGKQPAIVTVDVKIQTNPATGRPVHFDVEYTIDGKPFAERISNE